MRIKNTTTSFILGGVASVALLGATLGVASTTAQFDEPRTQEREQETHVGTYEPQVVFQSSRHAEQLNERMQGMQQEFQEAQQQGDQQRAMEIQGQMQMAQNEAVESFFAEIEEAMPEVAAEAGVKIVALEVVWTDPELGEPKDLTRELIAQLNGGEDSAPPASPFPPPSGE